MLHLSQTRKYSKQKALGLKVCGRDELHYKKGFYLFGVFCLFVCFCFCFCFQNIVQSWGLKCNQISCNRSQWSSLLYRIEIKPSDKCSGIETHEHVQGVKGCRPWHQQSLLGNSIVSWRVLGISCDVTSVVATSSYRILTQCLATRLVNMFARLCNLFGRASVDGRETRERRKGAGLPSESNEGRRRWTWRMWSKSWEVDVELPGRGGLRWPF